MAQRHHLRIWKTDRLVNGVPLWVAAATHDVSIQFVKREFRLFHRIDPNVDAELEFIAGKNLELQRAVEIGNTRSKQQEQELAKAWRWARGLSAHATVNFDTTGIVKVESKISRCEQRSAFAFLNTVAAGIRAIPLRMSQQSHSDLSAGRCVRTP